ncbi:MAG: hypothetical protein JWM76_824 [Pseudonocardiales bacterium]|nr:hypothetical protein [Pseudonocardiales bacterium]
MRRQPLYLLLPAIVTAITALVLAPAGEAAPSAQDSAFMMSNEQVNLAEIAIGNLALQRATSNSARALATMTISDHQAAQTKLMALAASENVTLPTAPNAQQQAQAATLTSVSAASFDLTYLQIQVSGHQTSIAATNTEIASGTDAAVVTYAKGYLPVAQMHLTMAQTGVVALGGATPTAVPAGNGGQAATTSATTERTAWIGAAVGLLLVIGAGYGLLRRRRPELS